MRSSSSINVISQQASTLGVNDVFVAIAMLYFLIMPLVWFAKPPFLKALLIAAGARADAKARAGACAAGFGRPDKFARADLSFYTLVPNGAAAPADAKRTDGTWRPVSLAQRSPRDLGISDCEVVEQFAQSVLPMFTTRNVDNHTVCVPKQESGSQINLKFESFVAAPVVAARTK
jgi:hypothetical protein